MLAHQCRERLGLTEFLNLRRRVVSHPAFDGAEGVGRATGEFGGDGFRVVDDSRDETDAVGFIRVDDAARECEVHRVALAENARETGRAAPRPEETELDARFGERRVRGRDSQVTGEGHLDATPAGRPVDTGDDDGIRVGDAVGDSLAVAREGRGVFERLDYVEVGAGAERGPSAAQEDHGFARFGDRGFEGIQVARTEGVAAVGSVEGDDAVAIAGLTAEHAGRLRSISKGLCLCRGKLRPMDDAVLARDAARDALGDIEPDALRRALFRRLDDASMTPGVLTLLSARAFAPDADVAAYGDQAAGVQLIYEGLNLTRDLAHDAPWATDLDPDIDADMDVVAAEVMVSRGFYLLARTTAAGRAVEVVRAFGRDQSSRFDADTAGEAADLDRNLEADVFELAVVTGSAATGGSAPDELLDYAAELARGYDGDLPPADDVLVQATRDHINSLSDGVSSATDGGSPSEH